MAAPLTNEGRDLNHAALAGAGLIRPVVVNRTGHSATLDGRGIVICFLDYGFDILHPAFRRASSETRFAALIDPANDVHPAHRINQALRTATNEDDRAPADRLYDPHDNYFGSGVQIGAHGSWVAAIAAGSRTRQFRGVAPAATLIGAHLDLPDSGWRETAAFGWRQGRDNDLSDLCNWSGWRSYEDNGAIVAALKACLEQALALRPAGIVFNLSIGAWAGAHDDLSAVNQTIKAIVEHCHLPGMPMIAFVVGTGNAGDERGHFETTIRAAERVAFDWSVSANAAASSKLEIWTDWPGDLALELACLSDRHQVMLRVVTAHPGPSPITLDGTVVGVGECARNVRGGLSCLRLLLDAKALNHSSNAGSDHHFEVSLSTDRGSDYDARPGRTHRLHAWLERNCTEGATAWLSPAVATSTLTPLACAPSAISVAGLDNLSGGPSVLGMSGQGPAPWHAASSAIADVGRWSVVDGVAGNDHRHRAPTLAAPAAGLWGARSKTAGYMRGSGTSGAAAMASGAVALAMQAAAIRGERADRRQLTTMLLGPDDRARSERHWRPDIGYGPLCFDPAAGLGHPERPAALQAMSTPSTLSDHHSSA